MRNSFYRLTALSALALLVPFTACEEDAKPNGTADTQVTDTATETSNGTSNGDTSSGAADTQVAPPDVGPDATLPEGCTASGFPLDQQSFDQDSGFALYEARAERDGKADGLAIELYTSGEYAGATKPGTYSLAGHDYKSCSNCVLVRTGCTDQGCEKTFFADEGDLVITQWDVEGGRFKAKLDGVKAREVTIDPETFASTPVPGGGTWCLDGLELDAEIKALPVAEKTEPTCVAEGNGTLLHANVGDFTLKNCLGEDVSLHSLCGDSSKKALWLMATAGWCSACAAFLEDFVAEHGRSLSRAKIAEKTPGLDMFLLLAEDGNGEKPTAEYCLAYAEDHKVDPAMVLMDWSDTPVQIPLIEPAGYAIETQALGTTWSKIDPYLIEEGGSVATAYPWWALLRPSNMEYVWSDRAAPQSFEATLTELLSAE
jgi:hypothetical protein